MKALVLLLALAATARADLPTDKIAHAGACWVVADLGQAGAQAVGADETTAAWVGFGVALAAGLAKEIADGQGGSGFDGADLLADTIGAGGALVVAGLKIQIRAGGVAAFWGFI